MTTVLEFFDVVLNTRFYGHWAWDALAGLRALQIVALSAALGKTLLFIRGLRRRPAVDRPVQASLWWDALSALGRWPLIAFVTLPLFLALLYFVLQQLIVWQLGPRIEIGVGSNALLVNLVWAWGSAAWATIMDRLTAFLGVVRGGARERRTIPREPSAA